MSRAALVPVLALLYGSALTLGCASSPYDRGWVSSEVARTAGHDVPVRGAPGRDGSASLPPGVASVESLTEDDAVAVALWNSAQFRADLAQLGLARADLADAAALPNPNLAFLFPIGTRQYELSAQYSIAQLVQRPWRVAAAKADVERVARGLVQSGLDTIRDVRIAWAELDASGRRRKLRARIDQIAGESAKLARTRQESGDVSALEADLVLAESLASSELAGRGLREEAVTRVRLRMLLGLAASPLGEHLGIRPDELPIDVPPSVPELERLALGSRPDLRASEVAIAGAAERRGLEKAKIVQLFARLDSKPVGSRGGSPNLWLPGVGGEIPIFSRNPGGRARADAELERAAWTYLLVKQQVLTDTRIAHEELRMAMSSLEALARTILPLRERSVTAALQAYEAGGESYVVVLDATRRLAEASLRQVELGLEVRRARARLDRAVGWRIRASR